MASSDPSGCRVAQARLGDSTAHARCRDSAFENAYLGITISGSLDQSPNSGYPAERPTACFQKRQRMSFFSGFFQFPSCPRCKSLSARRATTRAIDLIFLPLLLPLRCRICLQRFRVLRPAASLLPNPDTFYRAHSNVRELD